MSSEDNGTPTGKKGKAPNATSADEQVKFLMSCIRYSVSGKIDFEEVAKECSIVSKGAAAKRYERLMKAHNIEKKQPDSTRDASETPTKAKKAVSKKRKMTDAANDEDEDDEGSAPTPAKKKQAVQKEKSVKSEVKEEAPELLSQS
ncbi:MAG: hypothetical protein Q9177_006967 [Variospora cf. flavescens]